MLLLTISLLFIAPRFEGNQSMGAYLGMAVLFLFMLLNGLYIFFQTFVTRIVVKASGIEYHTPIFILGAEWKDIVIKGYVNYSLIRKSMRVIPQGGKLFLRKWAKPFQKILGKIISLKSEDVEIMASQFKDAEGHSLETDFLANISQNVEI